METAKNIWAWFPSLYNQSSLGIFFFPLLLCNLTWPGLAWLLMVTATTSGSASGSPLPTSSRWATRPGPSAPAHHLGQLDHGQVHQPISFPSRTSTAAPTGRSSQWTDTSALQSPRVTRVNLPRSLLQTTCRWGGTSCCYKCKGSLMTEANKIILTNKCYCILGEPARSSRSSEIVGCSHRAAVSMGAFIFLEFFLPWHRSTSL